MENQNGSLFLLDHILKKSEQNNVNNLNLTNSNILKEIASKKSPSKSILKSKIQTQPQKSASTATIIKKTEFHSRENSNSIDFNNTPQNEVPFILPEEDECIIPVACGSDEKTENLIMPEEIMQNNSLKKNDFKEKRLSVDIKNNSNKKTREILSQRAEFAQTEKITKNKGLERFLNPTKKEKMQNLNIININITKNTNKYYNFEEKTGNLIENIKESYAKKEYKNTINSCSKILQKNESVWEAYFYRGMSYFYENNLENSNNDFSKVLLINPKNTEILLFL